MEDIYRKLQQTIHAIGMGFPPTKEGYELRYLEELFTPGEAAFFVAMPTGFHTADEVAAHMGIPESEAASTLASMAGRGLLFRVRDGAAVRYRTLPVVAGFMEFNIGRLSPIIAQNFSKHFMKGMGACFFGAEDPIFRFIPLRRDLVTGDECLPYDDVEAILRRQTRLAVTDCLCRCANRYRPKDTGCQRLPGSNETCLAFGDIADYYVENGDARPITVEEALAIARRAERYGLTLEVNNTQEPEIMCCCCPCCCASLQAVKLFGGPAVRCYSNYVASHDEETCIACGLCARRCPTGAKQRGEGAVIAFQPAACVGCGLCVAGCPTGASKLNRKPEEELYIPPVPTMMELYDYVTEKRRASGAF